MATAQEPKHLDESNFMLDMMKAVDRDQNTLSEQQITDADATKLAIMIESALYKVWMHELDVLTAEIRNYKYEASQDDMTPAAELDYLMKFYATKSAYGQQMESQQDGAVQADQGQTSSDATDLQMKAQMVQGINSILSTLSNMLGRVTA